VITKAEYVDQRLARIEGLPQSASIYDGITAPVRAPYPAMCIANDKRCRCYTDQGTRLDTPDGVCRMLAERGFFIEWEQKPRESQAGGMGADAPHKGQGVAMEDAAPRLGGAYGASPGSTIAERSSITPVSQPASQLPANSR
jgi:hypothetical protein